MKHRLKFRVAGFGIMLAMCAVFGAAVMLLWNSLMPQIFGLMPLNYLQATGLLVLARILLGRLGGGLHGRRWGPGRHMFHHDNELRERWMNMSEEERKEFIERKMHRHSSHGREFFRDRERSDSNGESGEKKE
jgi:hypothetical protein